MTQGLIRRLLGIVMVLAVACGAASCAWVGSSEAESEVDFITTDTSEPQSLLIPADSNDVPGATVINLIYSGLMYLDRQGKPREDLAESVTQVDATTYQVLIREDAVFSDGSPVRAEDFVDTWNTAVSQSMLASHHFDPILGYSEGRETMRGLTVTGEKTFTIELSRPTPDFIQRLGDSSFFAMRSEDRENLEERGTNPIGAGPYTLREWKHNEYLMLVPNPNYRGPREAQNEGLKFVVYPDEDAAYDDLLAGQLDVLVHVPSSRLDSFEKDLGERAINSPAALVNELTIPANAANFQGEAGLLRRKALSMAIDRERIAEEVFHGTVTPLKGYVASIDGRPPVQPSSTEFVEFNPVRARELWEEAESVSPFEGPLLVAYNSDGSHREWIDAVCAQLSQNLGIEAKGQPFDTFKDLRDEVTTRRIKGPFRTSWQANYPSDLTFLAPLFGSNSVANESGYNNAEFNELIHRAAQAESRAEHDRYVTEAQDLLLEVMPAIPLWVPNALGAYGPDMKVEPFGWKSKPDFFAVQRAEETTSATN
ncbi:ABC transporter substrate-binding protein [Corynebacterium sp.]|uniref:peptide ABC transporter substrate-binding protein n=1 Tax=Corynebacterium sp. TaxID=1720 RepID=UPI0026DC5FF3|nr:ABC transporter substrate-binding protein [Corynebacterium sp.]MDO5031304.1 ABC transporter substrate-binding protein [Corynebacterium sp.]